MKLRKLLSIWMLLLISSSSILAQDLNQALRYIKVGNTLREAKQFSESENYLMKGKGIVERLNNVYWSAVASENLGLLHRDKHDYTNATFYFKKALGFYKTVGSQTSVMVISQILSGINNESNDVYGGIEIGSKGVKLSIIDVKFSTAGELQFSILKSDDIVTNTVNGSETAFSETVNAVKIYFDTLTLKRKLPLDHIFIVGSSGLVNGLKNMEGNKLEVLKGKLQTGINQPITFINACQEAELTMKGTLPSNEWSQTAIIDIGSGNTKGGYLTDSEYKCLDMLGVSTFTQKIEKQKGDRSFADACRGIYKDEVEEFQVKSEINRLPAFQTRNKIYLMGGIVYALTTFLHPSQFNDKQVKFTYNEVKRFRDMSVSDFDKLVNPNLADIDDEKTFKKVQKAIKKLREETFTQNQLIAGSTLLLGMMEEMKKNGEEKSFIFHRDGYIGWISGFITNAIEDKYKKNKEN